MRKKTMMKILHNPTAYNSSERLTAARLAITFLDLLAIGDANPKTKTNYHKPPKEGNQSNENKTNHA